MEYEYTLGTLIQTKKPHACGGDVWKVIRLGADIKLECQTCGRVIMLSRTDLQKRIKKIVEE
ncbi:MAG: DUF951 domain-containing protein [Lactobacillaceae bacterium]|jgi:hypothetical protein|nr:DUF951 domain-containing protein [Lactobacillaceae bacterium]